MDPMMAWVIAGAGVLVSFANKDNDWRMRVIAGLLVFAGANLLPTLPFLLKAAESVAVAGVTK